MKKFYLKKSFLEGQCIKFCCLITPQKTIQPHSRLTQHTSAGNKYLIGKMIKYSVTYKQLITNNYTLFQIHTYDHYHSNFLLHETQDYN